MSTSTPTIIDTSTPTNVSGDTLTEAIAQSLYGLNPRTVTDETGTYTLDWEGLPGHTRELILGRASHIAENVRPLLAEARTSAAATILDAMRSTQQTPHDTTEVATGAQNATDNWARWIASSFPNIPKES